MWCGAGNGFLRKSCISNQRLWLPNITSCEAKETLAIASVETESIFAPYSSHAGWTAPVSFDRKEKNFIDSPFLSSTRAQRISCYGARAEACLENRGKPLESGLHRMGCKYQVCNCGASSIKKNLSESVQCPRSYRIFVRKLSEKGVCPKIVRTLTIGRYKYA